MVLLVAVVPAPLAKDPRVEAVANEFLLHDCPSDCPIQAHSTNCVVRAQPAMVGGYPLGH